MRRETEQPDSAKASSVISATLRDAITSARDRWIRGRLRRKLRAIGRGRVVRGGDATGDRGREIVHGHRVAHAAVVARDDFEVLEADAVGRAVLLFRADSPAAAENFAKSDPYVLNGLIKDWRVREWTTVVGPAAEVKLPF